MPWAWWFPQALLDDLSTTWFSTWAGMRKASIASELFVRAKCVQCEELPFVWDYVLSTFFGRKKKVLLRNRLDNVTDDNILGLAF